MEYNVTYLRGEKERQSIMNQRELDACRATAEIVEAIPLGEAPAPELNLPPTQQQKVVSALGCLLESARLSAAQHDHSASCECQLCRDMRSVDDLLADLGL